MKIKLCKNLLKIINREFEFKEVVEHLNNCENCKKLIENIINEISNQNNFYSNFLKMIYKQILK